MPEVSTDRREFGAQRSVCACDKCKSSCRFIPGFLVPADLERLAPSGEEMFAWAEEHLRASPGATVIIGGIEERIRTLVPATKPDRSCHWLTADGACAVHAASPFGCAFFKTCEPGGKDLSLRGLREIRADWFRVDSRYRQAWQHLAAKGLMAEEPAIKQQRMIEHEYMTGRHRPGWERGMMRRPRVGERERSR